MTEIKIQIPEEVVNKIQLKDFETISMQSVIANILESHVLDTDARILETPVFGGYQNMLIKARKEFEQAKNEMIMKYVDEDVRKSIINWNLDYSSCILILQLEE